MTRPLLLDLFCCEGGASVGYHRAGFDVIGVDITPQPRYPFPFVQADALNPPFDLSRFDAIHASPPCQAYSAATKASGDPSGHPDLYAPTVALLEAAGRPYVIENVEGSPLRPDVTLCGSMFGLKVRRHRVFELGGWWMMQHGCSGHDWKRGELVDVTGGAGSRRQRYRHENGRTVKYYDAAHAREVMEMPWASRYGCTQAIPPAYSEHIGSHLITLLR